MCTFLCLHMSPRKNVNLNWLTLDRIRVLWHTGFPSLTGDNMCRGNNGGCSTLCLAIPGGRVCACADNQLLDENGTTCTCKFCLSHSLIIHVFWKKKADEIKRIKINLGKRIAGNHLGIILFILQIINWINFYEKQLNNGEIFQSICDCCIIV